MFRKKSLRFKFALLVILILVFVIVFGLVVSNICLSYFYMQNKRRSIIKAFNDINSQYVAGLVESGYSSSYPSGNSYRAGQSSGNEDGNSAQSGQSSQTEDQDSDKSSQSSQTEGQDSDKSGQSSQTEGQNPAGNETSAGLSDDSKSEEGNAPVFSVGASKPESASSDSQDESEFDAQNDADDAEADVQNDADDAEADAQNDADDTEADAQNDADDSEAARVQDLFPYYGNNTQDDEEELVVSDSLQLAIDKISTNKSLSILIYRTVYTSQNIYGFIVSNNTNELLYSSLGMGQDNKLKNDRIYSDYYYSKDQSAELMTGQYKLTVVNIERLGSGYMYLEGKLPNDDTILIRASIASIKESVAMANSYFFYILLFAAVFGFILTYFITGRFIRPISELTAIAKRMSQLDFTAKFKVRTEDEVGDLGNSINTLSESLEKAIAELKDANTQLRQDLEQKEKTDEMRKEFLSNVSHELKTPIALIQGYAEGLIDDVIDDAESRQFYCEVIMDEAKKMNGMVKQIMSLNQLEFGYSHVNMEYFDVTEVIRAIIARSDILVKEKKANVEFIQDQPVYVWSDSFMTDEVFTNYFTNALNHLEGEMKIEISLQKNVDTVRVSVFNTGQNIPEADLDRIWDKFYKVDKARTREYGGSGVGLSIVKATMNLLGQKYGAENKENGVLFWFELDCSNTRKDED